MIKDKHAIGFAHFDARYLTLWKCSGLPDDDSLEQTLKTNQFDESDNRLVRLSAGRKISRYFGNNNLSNEFIHILVEVPPFGG